MGSFHVVFDHVTIRASNRAASERFYTTVLAVLGIDQTHSGGQFTEWNDFSLAEATAWNPVTTGLHIGFGAPSRERVDEFWQAGIDAGYESDGEPGTRTEYGDDYYGGFLLDPDGNSAEAVHFEDVHRGVDHLWVRVEDVARSAQFYETIAPHAGLREQKREGRAQFAGAGAGSFSVLEGDHVTKSLHMAFAAPDDRTVDEFHRAALEAGYRDNGTPGERSEYHPGYYSAYVLDPDGNNIELVNHRR
jgi:catechol 2,3-dioxygenase-like lactoylglutathione lyase family enzyme